MMARVYLILCLFDWWPNKKAWVIHQNIAI